MIPLRQGQDDEDDDSEEEDENSQGSYMKIYREEVMIFLYITKCQLTIAFSEKGKTKVSKLDIMIDSFEQILFRAGEINFWSR